MYVILEFMMVHKFILYNVIFRSGRLHYAKFSRDIYKFVAIDILCYIILFYYIILLFQILN